MERIDADYQNIVDIAKHCDKDKLKIAENNAMAYDLTPIICDIQDFLKGKDEMNPIFRGGKVGVFDFGGLNKIYALFSYARYVENSIYVDTGSGFVRKDHGNSFPVQLNEVKDIALQHRKMADTEIQRLKAYICQENSVNKCICDGNFCDKKANTTLTNRNSYNVSKTRVRE